jgi:peroxiredoxin Q/BCP
MAFTDIVKFFIPTFLRKEHPPMLKPGDSAPAFTVQTHEGKTLSLAALKGKKVLLWFYPKADTPG